MIRYVLTAAAFLVAATTLPVQLVAQAPSKPAQPPGKKASCPLPARPGGADVGGQMAIDGAGRVQVTGSFLAFGGVDRMDVLITDRRGDARVCVAGRPVAFPRAVRGRGTSRAITLRPAARQNLVIHGRDVIARFTGQGNVYLSISGSGTVRLDGVGTFRVNSQGSESWPMTPITLPLQSTPRGAR